MPDKKTSEFDLIDAFNVNMYVPVIDPNEGLAENRNKRFTLAQLFGAVTPFSAATLTATAYPHIYIYNGSINSVLTLPAGADSLIGIPIKIANLGTGLLSVQGSGSDPILNSDPFEIWAGSTYIAIWDGEIWILK